jgi:hypothetical protein
MTRKGELWRGDIAQQIEDYVAGAIALDALMEWALEHPFFEDRAELSSDEQHILAHGLGTILQADPNEPLPTRTTADQLQAAAEVLWGRRKL